MKVLVLHNRYQQPGGEDVAVGAETALLRDHGHDVMLLEENNDAIIGTIASVGAAIGAVYSHGSRGRVQACIEKFRPDVAHVHNFFPRLSPSAYDACAELGVPVVQSLHNYRLLCANACFYRDGKICEACSGKGVGWPGIWNRCYRNSMAGSAAVVAMQAVHRVRGTSRKVDKYVVLTEFARKKFIAAGFPEKNLVRKPNFLRTDPGVGTGDCGYVLFVGRLSPEKGLATLLAAWRMLDSHHQLKIVGDGPEAAAVSEDIKHLANVQWLGRRTSAEIYGLMQSAAAVVLPSEWYEGFPLVIAEAFATGTPVIASRIGSLIELVEHGRTGIFFVPGDPHALAEAVRWVYRHPSELADMHRNARTEYVKKYNAETNYRQLMDIYQTVITGRQNCLYEP